MADQTKNTGAVNAGVLLHQILGDAPREACANWFGVTPAHLNKILTGECQMSPDIARRAAELLGADNSPWRAMIEAGHSDVAQECHEDESSKPACCGSKK